MSRLQTLTRNELTVLVALHQRQPEWACSTEIAAETGLPPYTARDTLRSLARRRLVIRGASGHWGQFAISDTGARRAAAIQPAQMELVG